MSTSVSSSVSRTRTAACKFSTLLRVWGAMLTIWRLTRELMALKNYPLHDVKSGADLDVLFPVGTRLFIKEPRYQRSGTRTTSFLL